MVKHHFERLKVAIFFYIPLRFYVVDFWYVYFYPVITPYRHNLTFLEKEGLDRSYIFGETPMTALAQILRRAQIGADEVIYDLGCGWGKSTFFLSAYAKAKRVIGIDLSPLFIERAEKIRKKVGLEELVFLQGDFLTIDYQDADVIYFYGTCCQDDQINALCRVFERDLRPGVMVITTSYSLTSYSDHFWLVDQGDFDYLWGPCPVFFHVKRSLEEVEADLSSAEE